MLPNLLKHQKSSIFVGSGLPERASHKVFLICQFLFSSNHLKGSEITISKLVNRIKNIIFNHETR